MGTLTFWIWSSEKWQFGLNHSNPLLKRDFLNPSCVQEGGGGVEKLQKIHVTVKPL